MCIYLKCRKNLLGAFLSLFFSSNFIFANPTNAKIAHGDISIDCCQDTLIIKQFSDKGIINWDTFSIDKNECTKFLHSSDFAVTLNRVITNNPSYIYGKLQSNGKIYLINQNGIFIGPNGKIDTRTFLGSTLNISNDDFLNNSIKCFAGDSFGKIKNAGQIHANENILLFAREIENFVRAKL